MICNVCSKVKEPDGMYRLGVCVECHEEDIRQEMLAEQDLEAFRCKDCGHAIPWDQRMLEPRPEPGTYVCERCKYLGKVQVRYPVIEPDLLREEEERYDSWEKLERQIVWD